LATATVSGLRHASTYCFHYRAMTKVGTGSWSDVVPLLVH
jgi:hypothetical protein